MAAGSWTDVGDEAGRGAEWERVTLQGPAGPIEARLYRSPGARAGVVLVGGIGGGFDSPAEDLYGRTGALLPREGVVVLRVRFRLPGELDEATGDVRAGIRFLRQAGAERIGVVGHSFGGSVVIRAALREPSVVAVVALSTQSYGAEGVDRLGRPLLLVHGVEDEVLPAEASTQVYQAAGPLAALHLLPGAGHVLDEAAEEVRALVHGFLLDHLREAPQPGAETTH